MGRDSRTDVVVVGAGPVGLLLGSLLLRRGIACRILERHLTPRRHSRSIGIHPVALEVFDELDVAERFVAEGHRIERGHAWVNRRRVGTISFARCPPPYRFILTLPQYRTEALLEDRLHELDPAALVRGAEVLDCGHSSEAATVRYRQHGETWGITGRFVVGCDGMQSAVRRAASIAFNGGEYPDTYVMGDFEDTTQRREDAEIHLHQSGLIESFPLPQGLRRWVVKTEALLPQCCREDVVAAVRDRLGVDLAGSRHFMLSAFGVQHYLAQSFVKDNLTLAGDAAHVISPIGGQGMNLGWLDAQHLAAALSARERDGGPVAALQRYDRVRRAAALRARRRGEFNMALGRKFAHPRIRQALVRGMLSRPAAGTMARLFTMRGL